MLSPQAGNTRYLSLCNFFTELCTFKTDRKKGFISPWKGVNGDLAVRKHPSTPRKSFYS